MSKDDLRTLIQPLSQEDKQALRELLDEELDLDAAWEKMQADNPLKGSVLAYEDPFGPACEPEDWEVLRDPD